jgi:hypothetical protein
MAAAAAASEELVKLPVGVEVLKPTTEARSSDPSWTASPVVLVLLLTLVLVSLMSAFGCVRTEYPANLFPLHQSV